MRTKKSVNMLDATDGDEGSANTEHGLLCQLARCALQHLVGGSRRPGLAQTPGAADEQVVGLARDEQAAVTAEGARPRDVRANQNKPEPDSGEMESEAVVTTDAEPVPTVTTAEAEHAAAADSKPVPTVDSERRRSEVGWLRSATLKVVMTNGLRQALTTVIGAIVGLLMARMIGPHNYGLYASGIATAGLIASLGNLGIGMTATRELAQQPDRQPQTLGTALMAQAPVGIVMGLVLMVLALTTHGERGHVMLVMVPSVMFVTFAISRIVFSVYYDPVPLALMDFFTTLVESAITLVLLIIHAPIVLLALNVSLWGVICSVFAFMMAKRHIQPRWTSVKAALSMVRRSILVGFVMTLASLYFTVDMAILGWLVPAARIGHYAASVKLLNLIAMVPTLVMSAAVPGIARLAHDREKLTKLESSLAHWTAFVAVPLIAVMAVFAHPVIQVIFGDKYLAAVPLLRVMMIAGALSLANNLLGITLVTLKVVRPQVVYNMVSLIVNVVGNIVLAPRYGVIASAWLTVVSELIVFIGGAWLLRRRVHFAPILTACWKPVFASGVGSAAGLALGAHSVISMAAGVVCFLICAVLIRMLPTVDDLKALRSDGFVK